MTATGAGALEGILVADFTRVLAGPLATMTLGDLGADVIKVERPIRGDDTRTWGPPWAEEDSTYFLSLNRNKRSITFDLTQDADAALARQLALEADVVVENFRPGFMERAGLGPREVRESNPRAVYCSISAFGGGVGAALPGYDLLIQAVSGHMSVTGEAAGSPLKTGVAFIDMVTGLYAVAGILAALEQRHRTGRGALVEVSLMDSGLAALLNHASSFLNAGALPSRHGNRHPSIAPYQSIRAADGFFVVAGGNDTIWRRMCAALNLPDLVADPRFASNADRVANADALMAIIESQTELRTVDFWIKILSSHGVPAGPINDVAQAFDYAEELQLHSVLVHDRPGHTPVRTVRSPILLDGVPLVPRMPPPALNANGTDVRQWLEARMSERGGGINGREG